MDLADPILLWPVRMEEGEEDRVSPLVGAVVDQWDLEEDFQALEGL